MILKKIISKYYTKLNYEYIIHEDKLIRNYLYNILKIYNTMFTNCIIKRNTHGIYLYINVYKWYGGKIRKLNKRKITKLYNNNINKKKEFKKLLLNSKNLKNIIYYLSNKLGLNIYLIIKFTSLLNANLITKFIINQLNNKINFNKIYQQLYSILIHQKRIYGFKIQCSGRPKGSRMASIKWFKYGLVPLKSNNILIDYNISEALTKYGICGIKVWIIYYKKKIKKKNKKIIKIKKKNKYTKILNILKYYLSLSFKYNYNFINHKNINYLKSFKYKSFKLINYFKYNQYINYKYNHIYKKKYYKIYNFKLKKKKINKYISYYKFNNLYKKKKKKRKYNYKNIIKIKKFKYKNKLNKNIFNLNKQWYNKIKFLKKWYYNYKNYNNLMNYHNNFLKRNISFMNRYNRLKYVNDTYYNLDDYNNNSKSIYFNNNINYKKEYLFKNKINNKINLFFKIKYKKQLLFKLYNYIKWQYKNKYKLLFKLWLIKYKNNISNLTFQNIINNKKLIKYKNKINKNIILNNKKIKYIIDKKIIKKIKNNINKKKINNKKIKKNKKKRKIKEIKEKKYNKIINNLKKIKYNKIEKKIINKKYNYINWKRKNIPLSYYLKIRRNIIFNKRIKNFIFFKYYYKLKPLIQNKLKYNINKLNNKIKKKLNKKNNHLILIKKILLLYKLHKNILKLKQKFNNRWKKKKIKYKLKYKIHTYLKIFK